MAKVIDGEASETDEEEDQKKVESIVTEIIVEPKKIIHVDEKIQQQWKHLTTDVQTVLWKRNQPAVKMIQEQKELTHKTFETSAAASLRTASENLLQIEDGLVDIREAADLLPTSFEKTTLEIIKIA